LIDVTTRLHFYTLKSIKFVVGVATTQDISKKLFFNCTETSKTRSKQLRVPRTKNLKLHTNMYF